MAAHPETMPFLPGPGWQIARIATFAKDICLRKTPGWKNGKSQNHPGQNAQEEWNYEDPFPVHLHPRGCIDLHAWDWIAASRKTSR